MKCGDQFKRSYPVIKHVLSDLGAITCNPIVKNSLKAYQTKDSRLTTIRGFDGSIFPPCAETLLQKIKRTNYVCWLNATLPDPPEFSPIELGWKLEDGKYVLHWFEGNHLPAIILSPDEDENIVDRNERYFSGSDSSGESDADGGYFIH